MVRSFGAMQGAVVEVIPVLDLKGGAVVHARMGRRDRYRPIETPLSPTSKPVDVARGLLSIYPFTTFYVADLDAIEREGDNNRALTELKSELPGLALWVDNGMADAGHAESWLGSDLGYLVLGSETQKNESLVCRFCRDERIVLSLDYRDDMFVGPPALIRNAELWPSKIIAMTLARVGSAAGPDMERLSAIKMLARGQHIYAAGGIRDAADLVMLARAGIAGALVATSLHSGNLTGAQIARL